MSRDGPRVLRAHQAHPRLPGRRRLRRAGAARAPGQQRVALSAAAGRARGDRRRAVVAEPLPRSIQRAPARAAVRPLRRADVAHRDRQRLVRHPARGRRGAARARRRARLRVALVLGLPAPERRFGRACDHRRAGLRATPRPAGDARGDHRRHAPGDRLQPEQPHEHRAAARRRSRTFWPRCRRTCA